MKKILMALLMLILALSFISCEDDSTSSDGPSSENDLRIKKIEYSTLFDNGVSTYSYDSNGRLEEYTDSDTELTELYKYQTNSVLPDTVYHMNELDKDFFVDYRECITYTNSKIDMINEEDAWTNGAGYMYITSGTTDFTWFGNKIERVVSMDETQTTVYTDQQYTYDSTGKILNYNEISDDSDDNYSLTNVVYSGTNIVSFDMINNSTKTMDCSVTLEYTDGYLSKRNIDYVGGGKDRQTYSYDNKGKLVQILTERLDIYSQPQVWEEIRRTDLTVNSFGMPLTFKQYYNEELFINAKFTYEEKEGNDAEYSMMREVIDQSKEAFGEYWFDNDLMSKKSIRKLARIR
ncbi:MAG: hypothetical protein JXR48_05960 [Candidatus Delongbacteria bacterium]|nr:hypothetical protein [Candidatus Delongbacteria bacterium]MBN2834495.1 hypothetical protein [Candidatus Delongbacteria bacterium]